MNPKAPMRSMCATLMLIGILLGISGGCEPVNTTPPPPAAPPPAPIGALPRGFTWHYETGSNFYIYRALRENDPASAELGIYFGPNPELRNFEDMKIEQGTAFGFPVRWMTVADNNEYEYQVLLPYGKMNLHIWVYTQDKRDLQDLLDTLRWLRLEPRRGPLPPPPPANRPTAPAAPGDEDLSPMPPPSSTQPWPGFVPVTNPAATRPVNPLEIPPEIHMGSTQPASER